MESSILYTNADGSVVVLDIPRSIELAQVSPAQHVDRRLISCQALDVPWQTQRPQRHGYPNMSQSASTAIDELMTCVIVQDALREVRDAYDGPWLLPRALISYREGNTDVACKRKSPFAEDKQVDESSAPYIPPSSHYLLGSISARRDEFLKTAPGFDILVLDPPWPSRSVRRKKDRYSTAYDMHETRDLLSQIPVAGCLNPSGLVAIWVTNKPAVIDLVKSPSGMFSQWGLEVFTEWIWVKVTSTGVPVIDPESTWRKPWERLLIARKKGSSTNLCPKRKVIFGVPDLHSRKPNLAGLFKQMMPDEYLGLEIFSRNLTAGWWSWGDQTLMFQQRHHWIEDLTPEQPPSEQLEKQV